MPLLKENDKWEWHGVKCAVCNLSSEIKIQLGTLWSTSQFRKNHEYVCKSCKRKKKGN